VASRTVSLVMPVWEPKPRWLREAVRSALDQTGCAVELIIVDDGNSEPVADLLRDLDDPRLAVIRIPHGGVSAARNAGIAHASGGAIRFIDSDDVLEPESTARLLRLSDRGSAVAYGSTLVCDPELRPQRLIDSDVEGDAVIDCLLGRFSVRLVSMLFPRNVVEAIEGFDPDFDLNEDWDYLLRALEHAPVCGEHEVATTYRRHEASATARAETGQDGPLRVIQKYFDRHPEQRGTRLERRAHARVHLTAADHLLFHRSYRPFLRELAAAARLDPRAAAPEAVTAANTIARRVAGRMIGRARTASGRGQAL
jgi:glycosyltransferase involved in cell wall biosynthesis